MRAGRVVAALGFSAALAVGCSAILNGDDLHGTGGGGDGGGPRDLAGGGGDGGGGSVTFNPVSVSLNSSGVNSVAIADVNSDGNMDIITSSVSENKVVVLLGDGSGTTFGALNPAVDACALPNTNSPAGLTVADVNGDGKPDIIVGCRPSSTAEGGYSVLLNTTSAPNATSFTSTNHITQFQVSNVRVADFDHDGKPDIALVDSTTPSPLDTNTAWISVVFGNGDGTFTTPSHFAAFFDASGFGAEPSWIEVGDFDNDGQADDIAAVIDGFDTIAILFATGPRATLFPAANTLAIPLSSAELVRVGDLDNSGSDNDVLAVQNGGFSPPFKIAPLLNAYMTGNPLPTADMGTIFGSTLTTYDSEFNPISLGVADFNNDGNLDAVTGCYLNPTGTDPSQASLNVFLGTGGGHFSAKMVLPVIMPYVPNEIATGDLNNDSKPDIVLGAANNFDGDHVWVLLNTTP
jgi:FG-GAP-like repeat/FG-GAP repeat